MTKVHEICGHGEAINGIPTLIGADFSSGKDMAVVTLMSSDLDVAITLRGREAEAMDKALTARYAEGYNAALFAIARKLHIDSRDIRLSKEPLLNKANKLADRIADTLCNSDIKTPQPLSQQEMKEREGKPVWFVSRDGSDGRWRVLADQDYMGQHFTDEGFAPWNLHNVSWAVFNTEGKEATS